MILAGSVFPSQEISLSPESIVRNMITLRGIHNYQPVDLKDAIEFPQDSHRRYPIAELVEIKFPLADAAAFEYAAAKQPIRAAIG